MRIQTSRVEQGSDSWFLRYANPDEQEDEKSQLEDGGHAHQRLAGHPTSHYLVP